MKITLELGARRIEQSIRVDRSSKLVIGYEEDDFGQLCPWIGQEDKRLKHCDGRAAKIVQRVSTPFLPAETQLKHKKKV